MLAEIQTLLHSHPAGGAVTHQDRTNLSQAAAALTTSIAASRAQMASHRAHADARPPDFSRLQPPVNTLIAGDVGTNVRTVSRSALAAARARFVAAS